MPLDEDVKTLLPILMPPGAPQLGELSVEETRAGMDALMAARPVTEQVARIEDRKLSGPGGDIPVRLYRPADPTGAV